MTGDGSTMRKVNKSHRKITSCYFLAMEFIMNPFRETENMAHNDAASQLVLKGTTTIGVVCEDGEYYLQTPV